MAKYHSDTESESYRYDDSNYSSDESVTDLDIPDFNDKNAIQIAEYLDSKIHNINKMSSGISTNMGSGTKSFQSPSSEKLWTPLSQSTPADIPTTRAQPKDILKAKSKLSKLSANANETNTEEIEDDEDDEYTEDSTKKSSFNEETPSKASKKKVVQIAEKKFGGDLEELKELRELKKYLSTLPNGSIILERSKHPNNDANQIRIITQTELSNTEKQIESLKEQVLKASNQNLELKEEISILKDSNSGLKENVELKSNTIDEIRKDSQSSIEKMSELENSKMELEKNLEVIETKLKFLLGNPEENITPEKYPSLNFKDSNNKSVYDSLELQLVDKLNLSKSHNIIKNILINLLIPFSETKQTIPKIARLLQNEDILCDFANKLHRLLYQQDINISKFQHELNGNDSLRQCTSQMYHNVEILYRGLNYNEH